MIGRALLCWLLLAGSAMAEGFPALYDVNGVAVDDVLNLRATPDAGSDALGFLAPNARAVEVVRLNDVGTWGLIGRGEGGGWAAMQYLKRQPGQDSGAFPDQLQCNGTEPFWSLGILPHQTTFALAGVSTTDFGTGQRMGSRNRTDRWALTATAPGASMTAVIATGLCSDGMSDRVYGLSLDAVVSDQTGIAAYSGCCSLTTP